MKKRQHQAKTNSSAELLQLLAQLSARASESERQVQALLAAIATALATEAPIALKATTGDKSDNSGTNDASEDFWKGILIDAVKEMMSKSDDFSAPCAKILEGMAVAARAHNYIGAANAFLNYQRCMRRPRPKAPIS